jgi:membrane protease YdiL (CAAX protease family)
MLLVNAIISAVLQVLVFTAIPVVFYLITHRRLKGFLDYIGLRKPELRTMLYATLIAAAFVLPVLLLLFFFPSIREVVTSPNTVIGRLRSYGFSISTVVLIALKALVQTSLSEEILFRGFAAKRLINWMGFTRGNLLQAFLFGSVHLLLFIGQEFSFPMAAGVVLFTGLGGWTSGYLNERLGNGSILPSWWMHGVTNTIAYSVLAFS